jgi:hypothetical protein
VTGKVCFCYTRAAPVHASRLDQEGFIVYPHVIFAGQIGKRFCHMKSASNDEVQLGVCCAANLLWMDMRKEGAKLDTDARSSA